MAGSPIVCAAQVALDRVDTACTMPPIRPTLAGTRACDVQDLDRCGVRVAAWAELPVAARAAAASRIPVAAARNALVVRVRRRDVFMVPPSEAERPGLLVGVRSPEKRRSTEHRLDLS
jgi:hypothetical protein